VSLSRGQILAFLDADDLFAPGSLDRRLGRLASDPSLDLVYGRLTEFASGDDGSQVASCRSVPAAAKPARSPGTMMICRSAFDRVGPFAEDLRRSETLEWFLRADEQGLVSCPLDEVVLLRRIHDTNNSKRESGQEGEYAHVLKAALDRRRSSD
jgi:hypothetical protein